MKIFSIPVTIIYNIYVQTNNSIDVIEIIQYNAPEVGEDNEDKHGKERVGFYYATGKGII